MMCFQGADLYQLNIAALTGRPFVLPVWIHPTYEENDLLFEKAANIKKPLSIGAVKKTTPGIFISLGSLSSLDTWQPEMSSKTRNAQQSEIITVVKHFSRVLDICF